MKNKWIIIILPIVVMLILFIQINVSNNTQGEVVTNIQDEIDEMKNIDIQNIPRESANFDTEIIIYDFSDGRISFEVTVFHPKIEMNQVIVSAFLGDAILSNINTPHSLVSNVLAVKNNKNKEFGKAFNMGPNTEIKGISAGNSMVYFSNSKLNDVLKDLPYILVKVSWLDSKNKPMVEYIKYPQDKYMIKTKRS
ncbi:hypothetical protein [Tepidibacillus marianensis]|uniref:hypothetical protein n=1 Tax=Tepidibacillus marianensis TaxID=3131995 RepID=UPI0030CE23D7